jgi:predicted metal-dependent phosphoesterase TrpH/glycosyltransferase involved in cell wall biosynthesis
VAEPLAIAHVTPFAWEAPSEVSEYVARVGERLAARGHRVLIIAPSQSATLVRDTRRALRADPESLLERAADGPLVLGVGEVLPFAGTRRRAASLPLDVARTIEEALGALALDVVHVHEPFAPSAASAALRHSRALNVGGFHTPTERVLSTQLARPLSRMLFARLDARIASCQATAELTARYFPGTYEVILPGADARPRADATARGATGPVQESAPTQATGGPPGQGGGQPTVTVAFADCEERSALRTFLRALRLLPVETAWQARIWSARPLAAPASLPERVRERLRILDPEECTAAQAISEADIAVLASDGSLPAPGLLRSALAAGVAPISSRAAAYEELLAGAGEQLMFEPGDAQTLAAQLARAIGDQVLRARLRAWALAAGRRLSWEATADGLQEVYERLVGRRHDNRARPEVARRLSGRALIDVDLHMHTDHSHDCATPVEVLLAQARARGLGAIAITDHNEISGALEAAEKTSGVKVIIGEEVKTASQGEVIGLFISERIPRGLTLAQTIDEIHRQGGIVYVPHPFDRLHSVPDYEHLLPVLDDIDAVEVFNPRVAIAEFNEEAARFAAKYRIPAGAGSDAHVPQGLGSVRIRMRDFHCAEEFLESLRAADITRNPASLLYVQALKFLQTRALPAPARRASRERRVRRAARKS